MTEAAKNLLTPGVIAERAGVPVHRVQHVITSRNIKPVGRAGTLRVFSESDAKFIVAALDRIKRERQR